MSEMPCTGTTFASLSQVIGRCRTLTDRLRLNEDGWRQNRKDQFFWRFVIPVLVERVDISDGALARQMLLDARRIIDERLAELEPKDGLERVEPSVEHPYVRCDDPLHPEDGVPAGVPKFNVHPPDLRTKEGREWKRAQAGAAL